MASFLKQKLRDVVTKYFISSTLGPDHILWNYLKTILSNDVYLTYLTNIANTCILVEH